MGRRNKTYSAEFKLEAVQLLKTSGKNAAQLERELDIGDGCLLRWKQQLEESGAEAFPGHGRLAPEQEELLRLRRELETVRQERDILKKAVAIFSHPSK